MVHGNYFQTLHLTTVTKFYSLKKNPVGDGAGERRSQAASLNVRSCNKIVNCTSAWEDILHLTTPQ